MAFLLCYSSILLEAYAITVGIECVNSAPKATARPQLTFCTSDEQCPHQCYAKCKVSELLILAKVDLWGKNALGGRG